METGRDREVVNKTQFEESLQSRERLTLEIMNMRNKNSISSMSKLHTKSNKIDEVTKGAMPNLIPRT